MTGFWVVVVLFVILLVVAFVLDEGSRKQKQEAQSPSSRLARLYANLLATNPSRFTIEQNGCLEYDICDKETKIQAWVNLIISEISPYYGYVGNVHVEGIDAEYLYTVADKVYKDRNKVKENDDISDILALYENKGDVPK